MKELLEAIENSREEMVKALVNMCKIPAISPESGGDGEDKKATFLLELLKDSGISDVEVIKVEDDRVTCGYRPNIIATIKGTDNSLPPLWIVSHTDVVPAGEMKLWNSEPFEPVVKDGTVIGRGVCDNGQSLIASIFAVRSMLMLGKKPIRDIKLALVADEEVGSEYGIKPLIDKGLFTKDDLILVPDHGSPDGDTIDVVEKAHLQLKFITEGKQVHASIPHTGLNAFWAASKYIDRVTSALHETYNTRDELFDPPISTFEATKKEANVPNINTIPGEDVFYMDCRILPTENLDEIMDFMNNIASGIEEETGAKITMEGHRISQAPPATSTDAAIVVNLQKAIKEIIGIEARPIGIGGGTCAALFREVGLPAAVWSVNLGCAHAPNEYCLIKNLLSDAKVFATLCIM